MTRSSWTGCCPVWTGSRCRRIRARGLWAPVLLLTARDGIENRVRGLDAGADDYLVKPFAFAELTARLRAVLRRGRQERPTVLVCGDLELDPATRTVCRAGRRGELTSKEGAVALLGVGAGGSGCRGRSVRWRGRAR